MTSTRVLGFKEAPTACEMLPLEDWDKQGLRADIQRLSILVLNFALGTLCGYVTISGAEKIEAELIRSTDCTCVDKSLLVNVLLTALVLVAKPRAYHR